MSDSQKAAFIKSIRYIYQKIDDPSLKLETIAAEIDTSVSSLKRLFEKHVGQSPGAFIRRLRMEWAFRSIQNKNESILEIALASGFEDHAAFSRSFKETFGYTPLQARTKLNIVNELECITLEEPDIVELDSLHIQCITKQGLYFECAPQAWTALHEKLKTSELTDDFPGLFIGIGHDNPHEGEIHVDQVRFSAGVVLAENNLGIENLTIAAGQYARFRFMGKIWNLGLAYHYIYGQWLEKGTHQINKSIPAFLSFDKFPGDTSEEKVIIHVPLSK